jgi:hypothetical protein
MSHIDANSEIPLTEREKEAWRRTFDRMIDEHGVDAMERVLYAALDRNRDRFTDPKLGLTMPSLWRANRPN